MASERDIDEGEEQVASPFGLSDVIACVRKRFWLITVVMVCCGLLCTGVALMLPNRYDAVATVQIDQRTRKIVDIEGVVSDLKADAATIESEVEVIKSKSNLLRVIDELNLRNDQEFNGPSIIDRLRGVLGLAQSGNAGQPTVSATSPQPTSFETPLRIEPQRDALLVAIEQRLKVARVRTTLVIEIKFSSADPVKAARIASAIADSYVRAQIEAKQRATELATGLLEDKLKSIRGKVAEAERAVEAYKAANDIFDADGLLLVDRQVAREMETLVKSRNEAAEAKARYDQARRMMLDGNDSDTVAEVLRSHTVRLLRDELTKSLRREAELSTKYGPRHPEMQRIAADVAKAQSELNTETAKIIRNLKAEYEVAADRVRQLEAGLETLKGDISASKDKHWKLRELEREAAASKQLYETLLARNKQTAESQTFQIPDSRILEAAAVPLYPAGPKRKQIVIGGTVVGLLLGLGIAFMLDLAGSGLRRPEDVEQIAEAPLLASVPLLEGGDLGADEPLRAVRAIIADPSGAIAGAVRELRFGLDRRKPAIGGRIIQVSSALPGEGSTLIAANLALLYAVSGRRVLLIDADLRRRNLSRLLGLQHQPGLGDALGGSIEVESAILHDRSSGLHVLAASSGLSVGGADALSPPALARLTARLRSQFDVIVLDTPPLLPVMDGRLLSEHCDQIAFVATWRRTPKELIRRALHLLGDNRDKVAGVVLNRVEGGDTAAIASSYRKAEAGATRLDTRAAA